MLITLFLTGCGKKKSNASEIHFVMPDTFKDVASDEEIPIPAGKTVRFYSLLEFDQNTPLDYDYIFSRSTKDGGGKVTFKIPDSLLGKERYIIAIVILEGDYELRGKTYDDIKNDIINKKILWGQISEPKKITLSDGVTISDFEFSGYTGSSIEDPGEPGSPGEPGEPEEPEEPEEPGEPGEPGEEKITVKFKIPSVYNDQQSNTYPMPGGKPIAFYLTPFEGEEGDTEDPIDPDAYVIHSSTPSGGGGTVTCELPEEFDGQFLKIHILIDLQATGLDLRGKTFSEMVPYLAQGKVLYGNSDGKVEITDGTEIDKLNFFGYPPQ